MARTIGKVKIRKLKELVKEVYDNRDPYNWRGHFLHEAVKERVPEAWFDIWESGWAEIERIISDELNALAHGK